MKNVLLFLTLFFLASAVFAQYNTEEDEALRMYQSGNYKVAAESLGKLFHKTKDIAYFNFYLNALLKSGQHKEAERVTKVLLKQQPDAPQYNLALGKIYKDQGQSLNAAKAYDDMLASLPKDETRLRDLANQLYQAEEYDLAIKVFEEGRKILRNSETFSFELLSLYRHKRDKQMLIQEYLNLLKFSPGMLSQAQTVLFSVLESSSDYFQLQQALLKRIQKDPDHLVYNRMLIWQYLQQQDYEMVLRQLIAADKRTKDDGEELYEYSQMFLANKAYQTAEKAYSYLLSKPKDGPYYLRSRIGALEVRYQYLLSGKLNSQDAQVLETEYQRILNEFGNNVQTVYALRRIANINAYYLHRLQKAESALETAIAIPGISHLKIADVKMDLADIYVLNEEPWEALLMYGQIAKDFANQSTGNEAQFKSARLAFFQGNFNYAKSQADVLKVSTSQLIANDALNLSLLITDHLKTSVDTLALKLYASAEFMQFRNLNQAALAKLDSIELLYPMNSLGDNILMTRSKIHIHSGKFNQAAIYLNLLIQHPQSNILTDDALFMLAELYENQLKEPEKAKRLYEQLIGDFPGSMFAAEARRHYRKLRGDNIGS